jgi:Domain of unknown function (DUF4260)
MKTTLKLEEAAMAAIGIYFLSLYTLGLPGWLWIILFFTPDIGMLGYLINNKVGAASYNIFHHKGIAIGLAVLGYYLQNNMLTATGILLFAHASFDRIAGYGLKYEDSFKHTHLGSLEKSK